jgi:glutamate racemase
VHLVITDSGLGGLLACALLERALGEAPHGDVRITYVNGWPEQGRGYNDLPDPEARARVLDRALSAIAGIQPDLILIACNTLSILYELTAFRTAARVPVHGIIEAGVDLFHEALTAEPSSAILLVGTRTTIESGVHARRLVERGVRESRIAALACHGLATAIERGPDSADTNGMIDRVAGQAVHVAAAGDPLFVGLCCTHYGMVADRIAAALAGTTGRLVGPLDPSERLVRDVLPRLAGGADARSGSVPVRVISKVVLDAAQRAGVADLLEPVSPATAAALRGYERVPDLF